MRFRLTRLRFELVRFGLLMLDKIRPVREGLVARLTLERLLAGVDTNMDLQSKGVGKELIAVMTLVSLFRGSIPAVAAFITV